MVLLTFRQGSQVTISLKDGYVNLINCQITSFDDVNTVKIILLALEANWFDHTSNRVKE